LVEDPMALERERKMMNPWTDSEKGIFLKKFTQHPKNFSKIASYFPNKTTQEVIWYYYTNKKTLDLKKVLQEQATKRRGLARKMPVPSPSIASGVPRELANLGTNPHYWLSETGRVQRASVKNVNYAENREESFEVKPNKISLLNTDPDGKWTENEKEMFLDGLARFAKDFRGLSNFMGTKTEFQCQNYYHNNKKKLNFDQIIDDGLVGREKSKKKTQNINLKQERDFEDRRTSTPKEERRIENSWSELEKADFLKYFQEFGKNWKKISTLLSTKSQNQIKYYYHVSREKLNLDELEPEEFVGKKRGRRSSALDKPRKLRRTKSQTEDSDSSTQPSPMITESPSIMDEVSNSPILESSLLSLTETMTSLVEKANTPLDISCNPHDEVSQDDTLQNMEGVTSTHQNDVQM